MARSLEEVMGRETEGRGMFRQRVSAASETRKGKPALRWFKMPFHERGTEKRKRPLSGERERCLTKESAVGPGHEKEASSYGKQRT